MSRRVGEVDDKLTDQEVHIIVSKCVRKDAAVLDEISEREKVILYADSLDDLRNLLSSSGVKIISEHPLVKGIVVSGEREKILRLILNDIVKEFDLVRSVRGVEHGGGERSC
jgi:hypothetical protein